MNFLLDQNFVFSSQRHELLQLMQISLALESILDKSTFICSSSPSPSPVKLSPVCSIEPSGVFKVIIKYKVLV
jgi:hypothetical protein